LASNFEKGGNLTFKKMLAKKIKKGIKTRRIHTYFKSVEKVLKNCTQKTQSIERTSQDAAPIYIYLLSVVQTLKHLWRPNLEIYGLEAFNNHKILGEMAGLRITMEKEVKYDIK
jgi:hypothetical protein